jgi:hypothetical protein
MHDVDVLTLTIFPENRATFGPCDHCGQMTQRVWGYVNRDEMAVAAYYVEWTPGHEQCQANFDLIVGKWGENANASDRKAVALEYRVVETGPAFMVIDAETRKIGSSPLISEALKRDAVIGTSLAQEVYAICDVVYLEDPRIQELQA